MISQWWLSLILFPSMPANKSQQEGKPTAAGDLIVRTWVRVAVGVGIVHKDFTVVQFLGLFVAVVVCLAAPGKGEEHSWGRNMVGQHVSLNLLPQNRWGCFRWPALRGKTGGLKRKSCGLKTVSLFLMFIEDDLKMVAGIQHKPIQHKRQWWFHVAKSCH